MGTRLNRLGEAVLTSTNNLCLEQKYENIRFFLSEIFLFFCGGGGGGRGGKPSVYLNGMFS